jgi:hypothetical protein
LFFPQHLLPNSVTQSDWITLHHCSKQACMIVNLSEDKLRGYVSFTAFRPITEVYLMVSYHQYLTIFFRIILS